MSTARGKKNKPASKRRGPTKSKPRAARAAVSPVGFSDVMDLTRRLLIVVGAAARAGGSFTSDPHEFSTAKGISALPSVQAALRRVRDATVDLEKEVERHAVDSRLAELCKLICDAAGKRAREAPRGLTNLEVDEFADNVLKLCARAGVTNASLSRARLVIIARSALHRLHSGIPAGVTAEEWKAEQTFLNHRQRTPSATTTQKDPARAQVVASALSEAFGRGRQGASTIEKLAGLLGGGRSRPEGAVRTADVVDGLRKHDAASTMDGLRAALLATFGVVGWKPEPELLDAAVDAARRVMFSESNAGRAKRVSAEDPRIVSTVGPSVDDEKPE